VVTDIAEEVRDILVFHLGSEEAKLTDDAKLIEDLGADSLDVVEVVMSCEERFDVDIPNHVATTLVTVGDAIAFIRAHIARNYPSRWPSAPRPDVRATS
jgi:acyl carrier protein